MDDPKGAEDFAKLLSDKARYLRARGSELSRTPGTFVEALAHELEQRGEQLGRLGDEVEALEERLVAANTNAELERLSFRRFFDLAPEPCIVTDPKGTILDLNEGAVRLLGPDPLAHIDRPLSALLEPESHGALVHGLERLGHGGAITGLRLRLRLPGDEPLPVSARAAYLPTPVGEPARIVWMLRDTSAQESLRVVRKDLAKERASREVAEHLSAQAGYLVRAAAELGAETDEMRVAEKAAHLAAEEFASCCVLYLLEDGRLRRAAAFHRDPECAGAPRPGNPADDHHPSGWAEVVHMLEGGADRFRGRAGATLLASLIRGEGAGPLAPARSAATRVLPLSARGEVVGLLQVTAEHDPEGLQYGLPLLEAFASYVGLAVANARLLREAESRSEAALALSRGRTRAMAGLSHELRTPLHSILGYCELLLGGVTDPLPAKAERFVRSMQTSAQLQAKLVDDILSLVKTPGKATSVTRVEVDVGEVVLECVGMLRERARARGLGLRVEAPAALTVHTDRAKLSQIILNLTGNAVKFTERGEVSVTASRHGEHFRLEVRDTGRGIAADELPFIFDAFWQGASSEGKHGEGAGLGLALVRRLVDLLGGEVGVETREGQGATFRVTLPLVPPPEA